MNRNTTLQLAILLAAAGIAGCGQTNSTDDRAEDASPPAAAALPAATANSIALADGRTIQIPQGVDVMRSGWTYKSFTAAEAAQIREACDRETRRLIASKTGAYDLPKPLFWVCTQARANAANFKK